MSAKRGSNRRIRTRLTSTFLVALGVGSLVAGCTSGSDKVPSTSSAPIDKNPITELIKPKISGSVKAGDIGVSPSAPVTVSVADGKFGSVTLVNPDGEAVKGEIAPDGLTWHNLEPLGYNREYTLDVNA